MPYPRSAEPRGFAPLIAGAAVFAAAELLIVLAFGRFFEWGRAEALLFLALRPWLLLAAVAGAARRGWRPRAAFYALALLLAAACESLLLYRLGAPAPWGEALRGLAAGAVAAAALDLLIQSGMRWLGRWGRGVAAAIAAALMLGAGVLRPYEAIVLAEAAPRPRAEKPVLMLVTGLPIVWGEGGFFAPGARPAEAYRVLQEEFDVRPLDTVEPADLTAGRLLLVAQPRALAPAELVALDGWVRRGGGALILADPSLAWPSELPLGDIRRPPPVSLLGPLLLHWGLALENSSQPGPHLEQVDGRRLVLDGAGRWRSDGPACRVGPQTWLARCRIGAGRAVLIADADLLRDALWTAPGPSGAARYSRIADNPLLLADELDGLAGLRRGRLRGPVRWAAPDANRRGALVVALLPLLAATAAALAARRGRR